MKLTHLATATAAVALLGGAAYAQQPQHQEHQDGATAPLGLPPAATTTETDSLPADDASASATTAASADVTAPAADASAAANVSFTSMTVTNGPVPDTAENRAKYGQPLSRAGKQTAARGN